jgi:biopolymer transport protein TolR
VVSDINVTSLVDVTMTLLIIFIIVAPMIEQGIDVTLPTAEPKRIDMASVMTVSVAENGRVYLEGQRVTMEELKERLANVHAAREDAAVLIKADTDLKYGRVVEVLDAVRSIGITRLAMATKPAG